MQVMINWRASLSMQSLSASMDRADDLCVEPKTGSAFNEGQGTNVVAFRAVQGTSVVAFRAVQDQLPASEAWNVPFEQVHSPASPPLNKVEALVNPDHDGLHEAFDHPMDAFTGGRPDPSLVSLKSMVRIPPDGNTSVATGGDGEVAGLTCEVVHGSSVCPMLGPLATVSSPRPDEGPGVSGRTVHHDEVDAVKNDLGRVRLVEVSGSPGSAPSNGGEESAVGCA